MKNAKKMSKVLLFKFAVSLAKKFNLQSNYYLILIAKIFEFNLKWALVVRRRGL